VSTSRRTGALAAVTAGLLILGLAACGGAEEAPSVNGDKKITIYSGRSEALVKPLLEKFQQQSGITVKVRYAGTAAMATQLLEEGAKSPADVFFSQDAGALGAVAKKGLLAKLPAEVTDRVPATYRSRSGEWVGTSARARVLAYNPDLVPADQLPKSVLDLAGPSWRGKIGIAPTNASFQTFVTALRVQHGEAKTREFLAALQANEPQIRENNVALVEDVNTGKIPVALVNHYYLGEVAKEQGVTVDALKVKLHFFGGGDTGALVNVAGIGVLKKAADDPDTRAFVDYLLSPDAQRYFAEQTFEYPVVAGVPAPAYVPPLADLEVPTIDLNDLDQLEATITMIKESGLVP
jgi:iron(III) transport system substrate-binding protein